MQELLGLVYSAQSQDTKAGPHLQKAVRLKPDSASARTNLAANLMRLGKAELAGVGSLGGPAGLWQASPSQGGWGEGGGGKPPPTLAS